MDGQEIYQSNLLGYKFVVDKNILVGRWIYPVEKFWRYEPSPETEKWCRYFGFGHEVFEPGIILVGDTFCIHPEIYKHLKSYIRN